MSSIQVQLLLILPPLVQRVIWLIPCAPSTGKKLCKVYLPLATSYEHMRRPSHFTAKCHRSLQSQRNSQLPPLVSLKDKRPFPGRDVCCREPKTSLRSFQTFGFWEYCIIHSLLKYRKLLLYLHLATIHLVNFLHICRSYRRALHKSGFWHFTKS